MQSLLHTIYTMALNSGQRAGTARPSLVGKLLDDYEMTDTIDLDHENDIKLVGAIMYAGKKPLLLVIARGLIRLLHG